MKTTNPMQLKAFIKKKAGELHISTQLVMQNYVLERLLERISMSPYNKNFILKGGFLISAIVGLDTRTTMDLDTTIKGFGLTHESISKVFTEVCHINANDDIVFELLGTTDIRDGDDYPGIRVNMKAIYPPISVPLAVDVTAGDKITPHEIEYTFSPMFEEQEISVMAYPIETVLAEKLETVVSRGIANTRARDFYDIYILWKLRGREIELKELKEALTRTAGKRGSSEVMTRYNSILADILKSRQMQSFWIKYQSDYEYAESITFEATIDTARAILDRTGRL